MAFLCSEHILGWVLGCACLHDIRMNWKSITNLTEASRLALNVHLSNINDTGLLDGAKRFFFDFIVLAVCRLGALVCLRLEFTHLSTVFQLFSTHLTLIFSTFCDAHQEQDTYHHSLHNIVYEIIFAKGQLQNKSTASCGQAPGSQHWAHRNRLWGCKIGLVRERVSIIDAACRLSQRKVHFWSIGHNEAHLSKWGIRLT